MTSVFTRRDVLASLLATSATAACANAPDVSPYPTARPANARALAAPGAERLVAAAELGNSAKVGFVVSDTRTGEILEAKNPVLPLPPASVTKALTTLYALSHLGTGYRFTTKLYADGPISGGRLNGNLWLVGGGDPTLDTDDMATLARSLRAAGVTEVSGEFRVQATALPYIAEIDPDQPEHVGYNPAISGLNLNFNRVHFEWKRAGSGYDVTMDARSENYRPDVSTSRMEIVSRDLPVYTYSARNGRDQWTVSRQALGGSGSRWLPVRHPEAYAGEVFRTMARANGVSLGQPRMVSAAPAGRVIAQHHSEELPLILRDTLKYSNNLMAEISGLSASAATGNRPDSLRASARQMGSWLESRMGMRRARFDDHSGLGENSRVSASDMVGVLNAAGTSGPLRPLMKEIRLKEENGGGAGSHLIDIRAKTGTLNFVSSLAGYIRTPGGRDLSFATFTADLPRRAAIARNDREAPTGARGWSRRSRAMQLKLIERWAAVYER
ncbi:D-alanyl-D-alanine carboxypeptidase/D-alanyl-D-alanine endopeptidase [Halocynthiibacter styelae]|uniref:D-alanyl-D-alanine carboxypeptidase/D-alanyl-D-alanine-endopeptidase n=1 Tax=Halocynthiibacter styelae TaxID=2761955 RepID=A0A8J7LK63_9RHOB|nr:D-alanyl-D-alanine carboxypeptidase/D-alanyl-D-alanine-endopeptidase [Paenihalocynthiibacter styelae]MBI1493250.1 D-alanyl-D-alanine carboxypeptidase/D-alanyl-D-alanine-endopeptidase [Paenihalocynthiibacter styelae]